VLQQPVAQGVDTAGEGAEGAHRLHVAVGREGRDELRAADVDPGGVEVGGVVEDGLAGLDGTGAFAGLAFSFAHCFAVFDRFDWLHEVPDGATAEKGRTVS